MQRLAEVGGLLKKIYRIYSNDLLSNLQEKGFLDLRPSFLEILMFLSEAGEANIKEIGHHCDLKKQTMTSHLNELEQRGYIKRSPGAKDRRELIVSLTEYGEKFKFALLESTAELEEAYFFDQGQIELERVQLSLEKLFQTVKSKNLDQQSFNF